MYIQTYIYKHTNIYISHAYNVQCQNFSGVTSFWTIYYNKPDLGAHIKFKVTGKTVSVS